MYLNTERGRPHLTLSAETDLIMQTREINNLKTSRAVSWIFDIEA